MFDKLLVANRGEIAVRVMAACEELGIETVAVYSDADRHAGHVRYADEAYNVGPAPANESYLDGETIVETALEAGADAIHPGYGFLAENADFAARVEDADGLTWVGPSSDAMERLGEKTRARAIMEAADVPIVPGTTDPVSSAEEVRELGEEYGYPIAIKADGGGGGRGMKVVHEPAAVADALESAQREGEAYFDNDSVYVEKYLENPKHIEVQIIADHHDTILHLGERDCSLQRRHQKIIEEAPSPALDDDLRAEIGDAARRGVREADYTNAGTVEFLVDDGEFYFMEVNTRIQVEHTATEEITGIDIVRQQIAVAAGEHLPFEQSDISTAGHAMEFRINAEDPTAEFAPAPGPIDTYDPPGGPGVRIDTAVAQGDEVSGDYDSMIAKLIVHAPTRERCLDRSRRALGHFEIEGPVTTIPFHTAMLADERFRAGTHTTNYLDALLDDDGLAELLDDQSAPSPADGGSGSQTALVVEVDGRRYDVVVEDDLVPATTQGETATAESSTGGDAGAAPASDGAVTAEMQGTVLSVDVSPGDTVAQGDRLCVLEAMKMENDVMAPTAGTVESVAVGDGDSVDMGDTLVVLE